MKLFRIAIAAWALLLAAGCRSITAEDPSPADPVVQGDQTLGSGNK